MVSVSPSEHARSQYGSTTRHLADRVSIYDYSTAADWYGWVRERLPIADDEPILDVGAGTGDLWREHVPDVCPLVLTDAFEPMCHSLTDIGAPGVLQSRAEQLPFRDASFAGVIASHVLYHLDDPRAGLAEMQRVCRKQGWIAVTTNTGHHFAQLADLIEAIGAMPPGRQAHMRFDAESARDALRLVTDGLVVHEYEAELEVPAPEPVLGYAFSAIRRTASVEATLRHRVQRQIEADGCFRIRSSAVLLIGRNSR